LADHELEFNTLISKSSIQTGKDFIIAGFYPKLIGFVLSGLFRYYYIDRKGEEFAKGFFPENTVLSSFCATIEQRPLYFANDNS
jgi:hypothetical protein